MGKGVEMDGINEMVEMMFDRNWMFAATNERIMTAE